MKVMPCPFNGDRNISEFAYFGPVKKRPDPETASDEEWSTYIFHAPNPDGLLLEWWCHSPTNFFFIAERNTVTDEIVRTYTPDQFDAIIDAGSSNGDAK